MVAVAVSAGSALVVAGLDGELGDPEVEELDGTASRRPARDEEVRRLEVAVDDPRRVHLGERLARLEPDLARLVDRQRALRVDEHPEVGALEVLHHDVRRRRRSTRPTSLHARDVLALHLGGDLRLAQEALDGLLVAHGLGSEELDGDLCSSPTCVAATTTPMPPSPRTRSTRYLPATSSPGFGSKGGASAGRGTGTGVGPSRLVASGQLPRMP